MPVTNVDQYLAEKNEPKLAEVRAAILAALPGAEECISYNMPTYKRGGKAVIHFAGWKKHFSIYPATPELVAKFQSELKPYEVEKGTIRFPLSAPVPAALLKSLATFLKTRVNDHL